MSIGWLISCTRKISTSVKIMLRNSFFSWLSDPTRSWPVQILVNVIYAGSKWALPCCTHRIGTRETSQTCQTNEQTTTPRQKEVSRIRACDPFRKARRRQCNDVILVLGAFSTGLNTQVYFPSISSLVSDGAPRNLISTQSTKRSHRSISLSDNNYQYTTYLHRNEFRCYLIHFGTAYVFVIATKSTSSTPFVAQYINPPVCTIQQ